MEDIRRNPKWEVKASRGDTKLTAGKLQKILLVNRGVKSESAQKAFLNPQHPLSISLKDVGLSNTQVKKAIALIKKVSKGKKIIVYGDYDADGVCASAILWETLYSLGIDATPHLPDRFSEGYGLNKDSIDKLIKKHSNLGLIITVDNGIVANEAVLYAKQKGLGVVISDHHALGDKIPNADAIIHSTKLCGASVAWMFAREIIRTYKRDETLLDEELALSAIGTLADQVPLVGANRSFAKHGLSALNNTKRIGLLALFREARVTKGSVGTYEVGFVIAPRINASGRMGHAIDSLRLLCTKDTARAHSLAHSLSSTNQQRQLEVTKSLNTALQMVEHRSSSIVISHKDYHEGVIGLIAGRLVEKYYRPAIVMSVNGKVAKASARSIPGFNIIDSIRNFNHLILEGGGHPMAAGFSILSENIDEFRNEFEKYSHSALTAVLLERRLEADIELRENEIGQLLIAKIKALEPFGSANQAPLFLIKNIPISGVKIIGRDNSHLKFYLGKLKLEALAFGWGDEYEKLSSAGKISCICKLDENIWNGKTTIQLKIIDISINE